ncbi:MAG: hypothetical protein JWM24_1753 [Solirubrobacterales bacterium]|nr:hypothetical protein [Solirubrobacterales bacterium]
MSLTITAQQRDALYDRILDRLSGIGDVWLAARAENFDAAVSLDASQQAERAELRASEERNRFVVETCRQVLVGLDETQRPRPL